MGIFVGKHISNIDTNAYNQCYKYAGIDINPVIIPYKFFKLFYSHYKLKSFLIINSYNHFLHFIPFVLSAND